MAARVHDVLTFGGAGRTVLRRQMLVTGIACAGFLTAGTRAAGAAVPESGASMSGASILALSKTLTGHDDLSPVTAARLAVWFEKHEPQQSEMLRKLAAVSAGLAPPALAALAQSSGAAEAMNALLAAWYTGTAGHGADAEVVAYADALMYWPVRDAMLAPTYCVAGPGWWVQPPPPVGVAPPVQKSP